MAKAKTHRKSGVYMVVSDKSEEFGIALEYAARLAKSHGMHPAIMRIIGRQDFMYWGNVEDRMREELRADAEKLVYNAARRVYDLTGVISSIYIEEGNKEDVLVKVIQSDLSIKMLILAAGKGGGGPGPLISYFTSKGVSKIRVPVLVVPSHVSEEDIESLL